MSKRSQAFCVVSGFAFLGFVASPALSQDVDGAIERLGRSPGTLALNVEKMADAFGRLEKEIGTERVAALWLEQSLRARKEAQRRLPDEIAKLTRAEAEETFDRIEKVYGEHGAPSLVRIARNAKRRFSDARDRLVSVSNEALQLDLESGLARLVAQNGGSVSKTLRAASLAIRGSGDRLELPFRFTAGWVSLVDNCSSTDFYGYLIGSIFVMPLAIAGDLVLLPLQLLYLGGEGLASFFTTTSDEKIIEGLRTEVNTLRAENSKLHDELNQRSEGSDSMNIRR